MGVLRSLRCLLLTGACIGMLLPTHPATAIESDSSQSSGTTMVGDVSLFQGGTLSGRIVGEAGQPLAGMELHLISHTENKTFDLRSDRDGRFQISGLRGGLYELRTDKTSVLFRSWQEGTAPPAANRDLLVVAGEQTIRGQRPIGELFTPIVIGLVIAAAIAIPIAVHNSQDAS